MVGLFSIAVGLALLYFGADGLVRGSAALAIRLGLAPLVVGLTVVAFGTSSPELLVSVEATLTSKGSIAIGNVVGSNICNIALILGIAVVIRPVKVQAQLIRLDVPIVIGCSVLLGLFLLDGTISRPEGMLLMMGIVGYITFSIRRARSEQARVQEEFDEAMPRPSRAVWVDGLFMVGGLVLLALGARLFVDGAVVIAQHLGLSQAVIGLTVVALGTSLPELATSAVASFKGEGDVAIGNVVGSNVFNILGILGFSSLLRPLKGAGIGLVDLAAMTAVALLLLPLMRTGYQLSRWEGVVLLVFYAGYIYYLLP